MRPQVLSRGFIRLVRTTLAVTLTMWRSFILNIDVCPKERADKLKYGGEGAGTKFVLGAHDRNSGIGDVNQTERAIWWRREVLSFEIGTNARDWFAKRGPGWGC